MKQIKLIDEPEAPRVCHVFTCKADYAFVIDEHDFCFQHGKELLDERERKSHEIRRKAEQLEIA